MSRNRAHRARRRTSATIPATNPREIANQRVREVAARVAGVPPHTLSAAQAKRIIASEAVRT
jgi:hypothetical protein